jgi:hypothetical protein
MDDPESFEKIPIDIPEEQTIQRIDISDDGMLHIKTIERDDAWQFLGMYWYQVENNGNIVKSLSLDGVFGDYTGVTIFDHIVDSDGNAYILTLTWIEGEIETFLFIIDPDGELLFTMDDVTLDNVLLRDAEGVVNYLERTEQSMSLSKINLTTQSRDLIHEVPSPVPGFSYWVRYAATDTLLLNGRDTVSTYDLASKTLTDLFTWSSLGIADGEGYGTGFDLTADGRIVLSIGPRGGGDAGYPRSKVYRIIVP